MGGESEPGGKGGVTEDKFCVSLGSLARALFGLSGNKMIARAIGGF